MDECYQMKILGYQIEPSADDFPRATPSSERIGSDQLFTPTTHATTSERRKRLVMQDSMPRTHRALLPERTVDSGQFHGIVNAITVHVGIFKVQGLYLDTPFTLVERVKTV